MKASSECPVSSNEIDLVPECYHQLNRCLCFLCTCGTHKCSSQSKSVYNKSIFNSSYRRSYSKPSVSSVPFRVTSNYRASDTKMDFKTSYMSEFTAKDPEVKDVKRANTPQPSFEFKGNTQYSRDYPDWGPSFVVHNKRPVHPIHETKIKFRAQSSYNAQFKGETTLTETTIRPKSGDRIKGLFKGPIESTAQREFKKVDEQYFAKYSKRVADEYVPTAYNPHQFNTTFKADFVADKAMYRDPVRYRREALLKSKLVKNN